MKKNPKPKKATVIAIGHSVMCSIEGCDQAATAFLQEASESAGRRIVKKSTPFCKKHALEKHEQIIRGEFDRTGQQPTYQPESYEHPHKLNEKN